MTSSQDPQAQPEPPAIDLADGASVTSSESAQGSRYFIVRLGVLALFAVAAPVTLHFATIDTFPTYQVFIGAIVAMTMALIATPVWITLLRVRGIGQQIREDGPEGHLIKHGTPTMGGVIILGTMLYAYLLMAQPWTDPSEHLFGLLAVAVTLGAGLIGFVDDFAKVRKARSLGLRPLSKIFAQAALVVLISAFILYVGRDGATVVTVPIIGWSADLGWAYFLLVALIVFGSTNAVNLTDGLDGLAAGSVMVVMLAYGAIAFRLGSLDLALFCTAVAGACVGFLWYNSHPANIFMGDTGSLALGGALAVMAILTKTELLLLIIGGLFVIEALSVIIQVISFKYWGKRAFKMAPIHHHFELMGWSETTIMVRFWIVGGVLAGLGFSLFFISTLVRP